MDWDAKEYRRVRARLQSFNGELLLPCWVQEITDKHVFLQTDNAGTLAAGQKVFVTIDGESSAMLLATVEKVEAVKSKTIVRAKIQQASLTGKTKEKRLLAARVMGSLDFIDETYEVKVKDLSESGAAFVIDRDFKLDALVTLRLFCDGTKAELRGRIRYSVRVGVTEYRCGIKFLTATPLPKATLDWLTAA